MASTACRAGLANALLNSFGPAAAAYPNRVRLFTNNHVPGVDDTIANYTELAAGWYAAQVLAGWTVPIFLAPRMVSFANVVSWLNSGAVGADVTVYGYYVTDTAGQLTWAERDPLAPVVILGGGGTYAVGLSRTNKNE